MRDALSRFTFLVHADGRSLHTTQRWDTSTEALTAAVERVEELGIPAEKITRLEAVPAL